MEKICAICGKGKLKGKVVSRKGQYKALGGTGSKVCRWSMRRFKANLQKTNIIIDGKLCKVLACAKCIKKGNFVRARAKVKAKA
jgi:ribosomal protein L28